MKQKRLLVAVGIIVLSVLLVWGSVLVYRSARIVNAFDEMYYSVAQPSHTKTSFGNVYAVSKVHEGIIPGSDETTGAYIAGYESWKKGLNGNENLVIEFHPKDHRLDVFAWVRYGDDDSLHFSFSYYPDTKTLELDPVGTLTLPPGNRNKTTEEFLEEYHITQSEIREYQEYFLYEKLLKDWVDGNGERSRFSEGDYGKFTIIDNTFEGLAGFE